MSDEQAMEADEGAAERRALLEARAAADKGRLGILGLVIGSMFAMAWLVSGGAPLFFSIERARSIDMALGLMTLTAMWLRARRASAAKRYLAASAAAVRTVVEAPAEPASTWLHAGAEAERDAARVDYDLFRAGEALEGAASVTSMAGSTIAMAGFVLAVNLGDPMTMLPYAVLGWLLAVSGRAHSA